jgi:hypothetical protein
MATFGELCEYLTADLRPDGDAMFEIPTAAPYHSSPFGKRVAVYLLSLSVTVQAHYTTKTTITVGANDNLFNLDDPANCALAIYHPTSVILNKSQIYQCRSVKEFEEHAGPDRYINRQPSAYVIIDRYQIQFDSNPTGAIPNSYVTGYYRHPNITSDETQVLFPMDEWPALTRTIQTMMRENVTADEIGFGRLQRLDQLAYEYIRRKRAASIRRIEHG